MKEKPSTKICKHCKTEIPYGAKVCPQCRKKQGMGLIPKILIALLVLGLISAIFGTDEESNNSNSTEKEEVTENVEKENEEIVEYIVDTVSNMDDVLEENAMKAKEVYYKKYVEVTGTLSVIDSDGKYFSLAGSDFDLLGVQCYLKNDDQKKYIMDHSKGDTLTVRVHIKNLGEIMGYSGDVIEFVD